MKMRTERNEQTSEVDQRIEKTVKKRVDALLKQLLSSEIRLTRTAEKL